MMLESRKQLNPDGTLEGEEPDKLVEYYMSEEFLNYVQEKYIVDDKSRLQNSTIMQMIYALEWYDIPRTHYSALIEFHPYLTEDDYDHLWHVDKQHKIENSISMVLFTMVSNRMLFDRGASIFKKKYVRYPIALFFGGAFSYALNLAVFRQMQK